MRKRHLCLLWGTLLLMIPSLKALSQTVVPKSTPKMDSTYQRQQSKNSYFKPASLIIPGTFVVYVGLKPAINGIGDLDNKIMSSVESRYPTFHTNAADYLMWAPSGSLYAMDAFKVKMAHNFTDHLILDAGSILITGGAGYIMRKIAAHIPAYVNHGTEFPSGHTANAFRGAEIVHQELMHSHPVWSYSGYLVATSVGLLRIYNKNHLFTEVLAGAALGILSTKATYWLFDKFVPQKRSKEVAVY